MQKKSFPHAPKPHFKLGNRNKPWFGPHCKHARKVYYHAKKKYNTYRTECHKLALQRASKIYKNTLNKYINTHNRENESKLRSMHHTRPKDYWKFLNSLKTKTPNTQPDLNEFYEHFKNINETSTLDSDDDISFTIPDFQNDGEEILNGEITETEIRKCIRKLKKSKSPGTDEVLNEYLKCTTSLLMPLYVSLFNSILQTGIMPSKWVEGIIVPIFKNKGDPLSADNYRPITLLSCVGKLFTAILNDRLTTYLEEFYLLNENQAGFRKTYSTSDHIFTLNCIVELLRSQKKKLFCAFIDFSKAFDTV